MGVTEAGDGAVGIKIAGYAVPARKTVVGTELHKPVGHLSPWICIAGKICSDKRIYIRSIVDRALRARIH